jgi:hypothetical protein
MIGLCFETLNPVKGTGRGEIRMRILGLIAGHKRKWGWKRRGDRTG